MKGLLTLAVGLAAGVITLAVMGTDAGAANDQPAAGQAAGQQSQSEDRDAESVREKDEFRETWILPGVEFSISEQDRQRFEEIVAESFRKEFEKAKSSSIVGRADVYLSSAGAATFVMELIEAGIGDVVTLVAERRGAETLHEAIGDKRVS